AGGRTRQELAERDEIGIGALAQPFATRDQFIAEIAEMGDRTAEGGQTKLQEDAENFRDAALRPFRTIVHSKYSRCVRALYTILVRRLAAIENGRITGGIGAPTRPCLLQRPYAWR